MPLIKLPDTPVEYTNRYSAKFLLDTKEYQMKQIYCHDLYEKNTVRHLVKLVKPDFTFFDVGSNIGFYALTFARLLPNGSVHCFEPNRLSFSRLQHNVKINKLQNIVLNNVGLADEEKEVEINYNLTNTGTASAYKKNGGNELHERIHLIKLDDYCKKNSINNIDFLKVDIEGGEYAFLKGAQGIIKDSKKLILVLEMMGENFSNAGYTSEEIFNYIISLGFSAFLPKSYPLGLRRVDSISEKYADNLIFLKGY